MQFLSISSYLSWWKEKLTTPSILQYPDISMKCILTTDVSNFALIAVFVRSFINSELNKPKKSFWRYTGGYQFGRKFYIITDHRPLVSLFSHKSPSSKFIRIRT